MNSDLQFAHRQDSDSSWCPVCQQKFKEIKQLKLHLLYSHRKKIFCFYCLEKKGWSDEFIKQKNYHEHFELVHQDVPRIRKLRDTQIRSDTTRSKAENNSDTKLKKVAKKEHPNCCSYCPGLQPFRFAWDRDRHLVEEHLYDICTHCKLIGPCVDVSLHILLHHAESICYICRSISPLYRPADKLYTHLLNSHQVRTGALYCPVCPDSSFSSVDLTSHLIQEHGCSELKLRALKRNVKSRANMIRPNNNMLNKFKGLRNDDNVHCHVITVLLLLAHTPLYNCPAPPEHVHEDESCTVHGSCVLQTLLEKYNSCGYVFHPREFLNNVQAFRIPEFPFSLASILRLFLDESILSHVHNPEGRKVGDLVTSKLSWKFNCSSCNQFSHVRAEETVISLQAYTDKPFMQHFQDYLENRRCVCGARVRTNPIQMQGGEFVMIEINRSNPESRQEFSELSVYPLRIPETVDILGAHYSLFCLVNPEIGSAGHYSLNFIQENQIIYLHETNLVLKTVYPGMDQTTLLLVLRKVKDSLPEQNNPLNSASKNPPDPSSSNLQVLSLSNPPPFSHNPPNPPESPQVINTEYLANKSEDLEIYQERNINYAINLEENNISSIEGAIELNLPVIEFNTDGVKTDTNLKNTDETNTELVNGKYKGYKVFKRDGKLRKSKYLSAESLAILGSSNPDILNKYRQKYAEKTMEVKSAGGTQAGSSLACLGKQVFKSAPLKWKRLDRKRGNNVNPGLTESIDCVETKVDNTSVDLNQLFHIL